MDIWIQFKNHRDEPFDVLFLVIGRDDDEILCQFCGNF